MRISIEPVSFDVIVEDIKSHVASLPGLVDSYVEEHVRDSNHYRLAVNSEPAGIGSIHQQCQVTQFVVRDGFRQYGQQLFYQLRKLEQVQSSIVPTYDDYYLAHAIDDAQQVKPQSYFFHSVGELMLSAIGLHWSLQPATRDHAEFIKDMTGDFFDPIERYFDPGGLFLTMRGDECSGFGVMERSTLHPEVASIGMFTIEDHRRSGVGTATITLLRERCLQQGLRATAGCWFYNHGSKRTLERAGMVATSRLLRVSY
ncbi:hypothetical protein BH23CHL5_BH23CHL5_22580 [soil metagenome]